MEVGPALVQGAPSSSPGTIKQCKVQWCKKQRGSTLSSSIPTFIRALLFRERSWFSRERKTARVTKIISGGVQNGPLLPNLSKPHKPTPPFTTPFLRSGPNVSSFSLKHERAVSNSVVSVRAPFRVSASVTTKEKPSTAPEIVLQPIKEISGTITLPGSKSLSNRILLLAALSEV